jgi:hypothetical protein
MLFHLVVSIFTFAALANELDIKINLQTPGEITEKTPKGQFGDIFMLPQSPQLEVKEGAAALDADLAAIVTDVPKEGRVLMKVYFSFDTEADESIRLFDEVHIMDELEKPGIDFIHLKSGKIMKILNSAKEEKDEHEIFEEISKYLLNELKKYAPSMEYQLIGTDTIDNPVNYRRFRYKSSFPAGAFHIDSAPDERSSLAVWIALEDIVNRPLSFVKSSVSRPIDQNSEGVVRTVRYHPADNYVVVWAKRGDVLVWFADRVGHGSPILGGNSGSRDAITFVHSYIPE